MLSQLLDDLIDQTTLEVSDRQKEKVTWLC